MNVFRNYARYYDLLYRDKDYPGEAKYVDVLIQRYGTEGRSILELGCGTGAHAEFLASIGYQIHGVDMSEDMLTRARTKLSKMPRHLAEKLNFCHGDIRTVQIGKQFDAVISLFHVINYQTTNSDLNSVFVTAKDHLNPGGLFIFDCWYGPAVLTTLPSIRVKRLEDEIISITRIAEPVMHPNENVVDVNYSIFIKDKSNGTMTELSEKHQMRYLFKTEIETLLSQNGFLLVDCKEWMTGNEVGFDTWSVCFVTRLER